MIKNFKNIYFSISPDRFLQLAQLCHAVFPKIHVETFYVPRAEGHAPHGAFQSAYEYAKEKLSGIKLITTASKRKNSGMLLKKNHYNNLFNANTLFK